MPQKLKLEVVCLHFLQALFVSDLFKLPVSREAKIERGEAMPLYGSGSAISDQISSDSKDHANNIVTVMAC